MAILSPCYSSAGPGDSAGWLAELGIQTNAAEFERLLFMLAHIHGGLLNASELARSLKISSPTVQRYVDILEGAFLLRVLRPYYRNFGKRVTARLRTTYRLSPPGRGGPAWRTECICT